MAAFLEKQNDACFSASNGAEGLLLFEKEQIDCVKNAGSAFTVSLPLQ